MRDDWYGIEQHFSDEELAVRDRILDWGRERVLPVIAEHWDLATFPRDLVQELTGLGIVGGTIADHGGPGLSAIGAHLVGSTLARIDGSISTTHGVHSSLAMRTIDVLGSDEQRARWLPRMMTMELLGAFGLTEPTHGSDVVELETRARRDGDHWVLSGEKKWIGLGHLADVVVIWARDDDGDVGAFIVDHDEEGRVEGFEAEPIRGKVGLRAIDQAHITMRDVRIPADQRLAKARTFADTTTVLTASRAGVAWEALGYAEAAYDLTCAYTIDREQFGASLASFQLVQEKLATLLAQLTSLRLLCLELGRVEQAGDLTMEKAALAKMHCARTARAMLADARDLHGGNGLILEHHVARHHADMEAVYTYEGADAVQALIVGRAITGESAFS